MIPPRQSLAAVTAPMGTEHEAAVQFREGLVTALGGMNALRARYGDRIQVALRDGGVGVAFEYPSPNDPRAWWSVTVEPLDEPSEGYLLEFYRQRAYGVVPDLSGRFPLVPRDQLVATFRANDGMGTPA